MKQFILNQKPDKDGLVRLKGEDYHYLVNVRRLKKGAVFKALLSDTHGGGAEEKYKKSLTQRRRGAEEKYKKSLTQPLQLLRKQLPSGTAVKDVKVKKDDCSQWVLTVLEIKNHILTCSVSPITDTNSGASVTMSTDAETTLPQLILFQAMPKEAKMDLIIRQAVEGGMSEVVPFIGQRSILKNSEQARISKARIDRWQRIVKEARQQSGSSIATQVKAPLSLDELFAYYWDELCSKGALGLILTPIEEVLDGPLGGLPRKTLEQGSFHHYLNKEAPLIVMAVGPEGGFSAEELTRFLYAGFKPVNMGGTVLRVETAALYAQAAVKIILMEKAWWMLKQQQ